MQIVRVPGHRGRAVPVGQLPVGERDLPDARRPQLGLAGQRVQDQEAAVRFAGQHDLRRRRDLLAGKPSVGGDQIFELPVPHVAMDLLLEGAARPDEPR